MLEVNDIVQTHTRPILYCRVTGFRGQKALLEVCDIHENPKEHRGTRVVARPRFLTYLPTQQRIKEEQLKLSSKWSEEEERARRGVNEEEDIPYYIPGTDRYDQQPASGTFEDDELFERFLETCLEHLGSGAYNDD
jgi:hypothetical protein